MELRQITSQKEQLDIEIKKEKLEREQAMRTAERQTSLLEKEKKSLSETRVSNHISLLTFRFNIFLALKFRYKRTVNHLHMYRARQIYS